LASGHPRSNKNRHKLFNNCLKDSKGDKTIPIRLNRDIA